MLSSSTFLLALLATVANASLLRRQSSWGGALSLGPAKSNIISAVTTLIPGPAPSTQNGELFLWPGMSNGTGDLIQTTLESWPTSTGGNAWCEAAAGQWCVRASIFGSFGQLDGTAGVVSGTDQVKIVYTLDSDGVTWMQTVTNAVTGAALSSYSYPAGPYMDGYGTGTECDDYCSGTVAAQTYENTVITLAAADPTFGDTLSVSGGTTYTGLTSSESGKIWTIASINIPAMVAGVVASTTTSSTKTSSTSSSSSSGGGSGTVAKYGQCGGEDYIGSTSCASGSTCTYSNAYYSQCL